MDIISTNKKAIEYYKTVAQRLQNFCKPLNDYLGIPLFLYYKVYNDSRYVYLSNDMNFAEQYISSISYESTYFRAYLNNNCSYKQKLWPRVPESKSMELVVRNGYWHGISLIEENKDNLIFYDFIAHNHNSTINEFYIQQSYILGKFIDYFKKTFAKDVLIDIEKNLLIYKDGHSVYLPTYEMDSDQFNTKMFLQAMNIDSNSIKIGQHSIHLSNSEKHCLELWSKGLTIKDIARSKLISPRTVETHLNRVKEKTGLYYKSQLLSLYGGSLC